MLVNIRKIGNSQGIIIPKTVLQEIGNPDMVKMTPTKDGILISPMVRKNVRRKPRNKDETDLFYDLMKSKIERNISVGKTRWVGNREMERRL